jgi:lysophospholipase
MTASRGDGWFAPPAVRSIDSNDGVALLYRAWEVDAPRAHVLIVHGLGEHSGRYAPLAEALVARNFSVYAPDLRGHGVSGGRRGHVGSFQNYLGDLERITRVTAGGSPSILLGHSLGGLIALRAAQTGLSGPLAGLVLSAPAVDLPGPDPLWRRAASAALARLTPTLELSNGIDPDDLSRDPDAVAAYRADPLIHDRITPRMYREMRRAMDAAAAEAECVRLPVLLLAPGEDRITRVPTAVALSSRFAGDVEVRPYPDFYHEPLHDPEGATVIADVLAWIEQRVA